MFQGGADRLSFVTVSPPISLPAPIPFVAVTLSMDAGNAPGLAIREKALPNFNPFEAVAPSAVDPTITAIRFRYLRDEGYDWDEALIRRAAPIVQEKIERFGQFPDFAGFLFRDIEPDLALLNGAAPVVTAAREELERVEPFAAPEIEAALRALADRLELSPRKAFEPIRVAVTGSKVSPGLFESLELLGKEETLRRLSAAAGRAAA